MPVSRAELSTAFTRVKDRLGRTIAAPTGPSNFIANKQPGRETRLTNITAYREFGEHIDDVRGLIMFLRSAFPEETLTAKQMQRFADGLAALPVYMAYRRYFPVPEDAIPPSVIDVARTSAGISRPLAFLIAGGVDENTRLPVDTIYDFANGKNPQRKNYFLGEDGITSCPAPHVAVKEILSLMISKPIGKSVNPAADWAGLIELPEIDNILEFGPHYREFLYNSYKLTLPGQKNLELQRLAEEAYIGVNRALGYIDPEETLPGLVIMEAAHSRKPPGLLAGLLRRKQTK